MLDFMAHGNKASKIPRAKTLQICFWDGHMENGVQLVLGQKEWTLWNFGCPVLFGQHSNYHLNEVNMRFLTKKLNVYIFITIVFFFIIGCQSDILLDSTTGASTVLPLKSPGVSTNQPTSTSSGEITSVPEIIKSPTALFTSVTTVVVPTYTPFSTLSPSGSISLVLELLQNNPSCLLPCWWGITPGETSWQDF